MSSDSFQMPQYVLDRIMNKRGRLHVFDALLPERTAFVIIDMQNAFVKGKVKAETALAIMPKINQLAAKVRELGGQVAWVRLQAGDSDGGETWQQMDRFLGELRDIAWQAVPRNGPGRL